MNMKCDLCGRRAARIRRVTRNFGRGVATFLIEGVPVVTCTACCESYVTADTLHEIERIRARHKKLGKIRRLRVVTFGGAV
jgi:YgiT-type zinc finger domain-containing protein